MSASDIAISIRGLSKAYTIRHDGLKRASFREVVVDKCKHPFRKATTETFWALKDVSFDVQRGDVVGIIGRNGAGKSTLLKMLSRIVEPTTGAVDLYGRVGSLLEVGTGFHPELTGRENIFLNGAILGMTRAEIRRHFDEIVAFAEVERFLDTPVKRYSSGMYVRLAFAVAAHLNTEILIVDEVLAVGDAAFQKKCLGKMKEISEEGGRTVLFVSHNMGAVRALCTTAVWLRFGEVKMIDETEKVLSLYAVESVSRMGQVIDISAHPHMANLAERLRINRIVINNGEPVRHDTPLRIDIEFYTLKDVEDVSFSVGFSNQDGGRIITVDSDLESPRHAVKGGVNGRVTLTLENMMVTPGVYLFDVGSRSGETFALDFLPGFTQIEILPGPRTPGYLIDAMGSARFAADVTWFLGSSQ